MTIALSKPQTYVASLAVVCLMSMLLISTAQAQTTTANVTTTENSHSLTDSILGTMRVFGLHSGLVASDVRVIVANLIRSALSFVGLICVVQVLIAGFTIMVSGGNEERVADGKKTLINACVGLFVILLSYSIVTYVTNLFSAPSINSEPANLPSSETL